MTRERVAVPSVPVGVRRTYNGAHAERRAGCEPRVPEPNTGDGQQPAYPHSRDVLRTDSGQGSVRPNLPPPGMVLSWKRLRRWF